MTRPVRRASSGRGRVHAPGRACLTDPQLRLVLGVAGLALSG
ncbi:MAG: hypothetical protein QOE23_3533, partial [Pseudonocardiales bacterium]|nr:hypothetical protein [Pseudonocardiales bacterium]